ncbi:MAG: hypothetical protein JWR07_413 [Nevskia sp.]|nr:hypothetical protein [Nevskia sp.]
MKLHRLTVAAALAAALLASGCNNSGDSSSSGSSSSSSSGGSSSSSGAAAAASYWMPYVAGPSSGATGGKTGVFVVPSDHPTATPTMMTSNAVASSGIFADPLATSLEEYLTDNSGAVSGTITSSGYYVTSDGVGNHLYHLDLRDTSKVPSPVQVGAPLAASAVLCDMAVFEQTLNTPSSVVILVHAAGADNSCISAADDVVYLYHAGDGSGVAPVVTPIAAASPIQSTATPIEDGVTGNLAGLVYIDGRHNLSFSDLSFIAPKTLVTGASAYSLVYSRNGYAFVEVIAAGKGSLYRVSAAGAISDDLYDFQPSNQTARAVEDSANGNLWFEDVGGTFDHNGVETAYSVRLVRLPISGSAVAQVIYSTSNTVPAGFQGLEEAFPVGVFGSSFIFDVQSFGIQRNTPALPASVYALPVNATAGTAPTVITSLPFGWFGGNQIVNSQLFLSVHNAIDANSSAISNSIEVLDASGAVLKNYPQSLFEGSVTAVSGKPLAPQLSTPVIYLAEGYTAPVTSSDPGGATVYAVSTAVSLEQAPVTVPGGGSFMPIHGEQPGVNTDGPAVMMNFDSDSSSNLAVSVLDVLANQWISIANPASTTQQPFAEAGQGFGPAGSGF